MSDQLLKIRQLSVDVGEKEILHQIDLDIHRGETHVLMGPNGAGKSTLGYALMGNPRYEVSDGDVVFDGKAILEENADFRAKAGLFLSFQNPLEVPCRTSFGTRWSSRPANGCGSGISESSSSRNLKFSIWTRAMQTGI